MKLQASLPTFLLSLTILSSASLSLQNPTTSNSDSAAATEFIRESCNKTLYPDTCYSSLSDYANSVQQDPSRLARLAIAVALAKARNMTNYVSNITRDADYSSSTRASSALHDCMSNFGDAVDELRDSLKQMRELMGTAGSSGSSFSFLMSNVQTWMSAALTDEDTCTDGFEDVEDGPMKAELCRNVGEVKMCTSNALALVNSYAELGGPRP